jgi:PAS domain S-box-containing protein
MMDDMKDKTKEELLLEVADLQMRLQEATETLSAIRKGEVDALVVSAPEGERVYTLRGASQVYRVFVESMSEGALSLSEDGAIFYCNRRFSDTLGLPLETLMGAALGRFVAPSDQRMYERIFEQGKTTGARGELSLLASEGIPLPVQLSVNPLKMKGDGVAACAIVTDLREHRRWEEILASEKLSRSILEQATEAVVVCDSTGIVIRASRAACELCGENPLLRPFHEVFGLQYSSGAGAFSVSAPLQGESITGAELAYERGGTKSHLLVNVGPLVDENQKIIGCVVTLTNITDLKESQRLLLAQRAEVENARLEVENRKLRLEAVMKALPVGVAITDISGGVSEANKAYEEIWRGGRPETHSVTDYEHYKAWWSETGKPLKPAEWASAVAVQKNQAVEGQLLEIKRFDGTRAFVINSAAPVRDASGKNIGSVVAIQDISELRKAREALLTSEARYMLLSETADRLLKSADPQKVINRLCRRVMEHLDCQVFFNFLADEKSGKLRLNAFAGIPEEEAEKIEWLEYGAAVCGCVAREEKPIVVEYIFETPDVRTELVKSYGVQAYACHPLIAQGRLAGTLSFGTKTRSRFSSEDLALMKTVTNQVAVGMERMRLLEQLRNSRDELETRVRERTAELERKNQELQDFAFIASHDLQEPLRKIQAFGDILGKKSASLGADSQDYILRMQKAAARMQRLLESLLAYSRVTTKVEPFVETDLKRSVQGALSNLEVVIKEKGALVKTDDLPTIEADRSQMIQLFQNLIANALKFQRENEIPRISIYWRKTRKKQTCDICVEDNGIGFDEKFLGKIFVPFQRLHGRTSRYQGVGMGLAICKKIVERHGGQITAESEPGKGSRFVVTLPAKKRKKVSSKQDRQSRSNR